MVQQDVQLHTSQPGRAEGHTCGCAHDDADPVLDVRPIPHAIRHGAVLGAFGATPPGSSLVIVAPHDPLPLLAQLRELAPIEVGYLERGPEEWHVRITRLG
ncbi:MAG: hemerythrin [Micrococcales bacterium 73-15]|uniref:DUF2249 domain-containing protein n=1 Tax=Salana multivorans TaxID=120377 RepID=UPI000961DC49|nr:DUF2249 domain-containing protein [Salana multivorans]OJX95463.1 MAG: hemerythrin [Micrococcales bacterium 73-15]